MENFITLLFFLRKRRQWAFSFVKQIRFRSRIHQPFGGFFDLILPTKRTFEPTVLLLKKAGRCHPFLAVVRCLFHNHLRLKRSSLLNVYLNCKFELANFSLIFLFVHFDVYFRLTTEGNSISHSEPFFDMNRGFTSKTKICNQKTLPCILLYLF